MTESNYSGNEKPYQEEQMPVTPDLVRSFKHICQERWKIDDYEMAKLLHLEGEKALYEQIIYGEIKDGTAGDVGERMLRILGISVGLGELFNDDMAAEYQWISSTRPALNGNSPLDHMLKGNIRDIMDVNTIVAEVRNLR